MFQLSQISLTNSKQTLKTQFQLQSYKHNLTNQPTEGMFIIYNLKKFGDAAEGKKLTTTLNGKLIVNLHLYL